MGLGQDLRAARADGVHPGSYPCAPVTLPLVLQAKTDQAVMVTGIKVKVLSDVPLPKDGQKPSPATCTGTAHEPMFDVNLTQSPVPVVPTAKKAESNRTDFPFTVSADAPKQLSLRINPGKGDVRFALKVEWVAGGEYGSATLGNDRDPRTEGSGYHVAG